VIIVDLNKLRLYVFEHINGVPRLIKGFYATIGKNGFGKYKEGDQRTLVRVYFVSSFIGHSDLPDLYGEGAFPINYPNVWDRKNGYTGYGIWLHVAPSNTCSQPPRDSDGCVIVSNQGLLALTPYIKMRKTPVILTKNIDWVDKDVWIKQQAKYWTFVEQWRRDWKSLNTDLYLSHYSAEYSGLEKDYENWVEYKHRVNSTKKFVKVGLSDTSIFLYPDEGNIFGCEF